MPYKCCDHCVEDPSYHEDYPADSHDTTCNSGPHRHCESGGDEWVAEKKEDA